MIGSLCTGYGGLDQAVAELTGADTAWVSDLDPGATALLEHRYPGVPNVGDLTVVDWSTVEPVDYLVAGYPCQPYSNAGKRLGNDDPRAIFPAIIRAIRALEPRLVFLENVRGHLGRGFDSVLGALADAGYDAGWRCLRASDVGAAHRRERLFIVAWPAAADSADHDGHRSAAAGTPGGRARLTPADTDSVGLERSRRARHGRPGPADGAVTPADASSDGRHQGRPEPARLVGGSDDALGGAPAPADTHGDAVREQPVALAGRRSAPVTELPGIAWGAYEPAVRRWEQLTRPAPSPTEPSRNGKPRLSPAFVEWMQGIPAGWVTDVPGLTRNQQLKLLGNGVVPQQAHAAYRLLLDDLGLTVTHRTEKEAA